MKDMHLEAVRPMLVNGDGRVPDQVLPAGKQAAGAKAKQNKVQLKIR